MAQHVIDLPCIADAYCSSENPSVNYGSATILNAGGYIGYTIPGKYNRFYALAKFNWSSLPARKKVTSVKIRAYSVKAMTGAATSRLLYNYNNKDFTENLVTFNIFGDNVIGSSDLAGQSIALNAWVEFGELQSIYNSLVQNSLVNYGVHFLWWNDPSGAWSADYWQVQSKENTNPPILRVTYEDVPPDAPTLTDPIGEFKDNTSIIRFLWTYNTSIGGVQKAFDLQWSIDQTTWVTVSQTTANNYYDMPANILPSGNIYWRVRCYNEYDEVSTYSSVSSFYAVGAPAAPVIQSLTAGTARPTVTWLASAQQQIYELKILQGETIVYESGYQPGISTRSHKVKAFLPDGDYILKIRIKNEYDLYSDWGETTFIVSTTKPNAPTMTLQRTKGGVEIYISAVTNAIYYIIYRSMYGLNNYISIGKTTELIYTDMTGVNKQEYNYFVRAVTADESYSDSKIIIGSALFDGALIASTSDFNNLFEVKLNMDARPKRSYSQNNQMAEVFYSGRNNPVIEISEFIKTSLTLEFAAMSYAELEKFIDLYNKNSIVLYRHANGRRIFGVLNGLSVHDSMTVFTINIVITQVDYIEALEV